MTAETPTPSARTFAWLAVGMVAFTIYGSLVPFHFHARSFDDATRAFGWVLEHRHGIESRSDFAANFILGVPLGFCLLAALRLDRPANPIASVITLQLLWPLCILFSSSVEFAQLYFPERTCSGSDIIAQSLGSLVGMLSWLAFGDRLVRRFRLIWQGDRIGGTAGRVLFVYVSLLCLVMWLPLDLTLSPAELYHKNLDWKTKIVFVPFVEITKPGGPALDVKLPVWLELAGLYSIAGMLAAGINRSPWKDRQRVGAIALRGLLLAVLLEGGQLFVMSRTTSITDVIVGTLGFVAGWGAVRSIHPAIGRGLSLDFGLLLGQAWIGWLLAMYWLPFDFDRSLLQPKWDDVNWVPFAVQYEKNYLNSLEEAASKTLLYTPLGAIVVAVGVRRVVRKWRAVALGVLVASIVEVGQLMLPGRVAGPTDLIFGGVGTWLGAIVALRLRAFGFGEYQPAPPKSPVRFKVK